MATDKEVQTFVHTLEEGKWVPWVRFALLVTAMMVLTLIFSSRFRGLSTANGIEQAQIAREIARGNGFTTKMIRPLAVWQLTSDKEGANNKQFPADKVPDTYNAPLNPYVNSFFLGMIRDSWGMTPKINLYVGDRAISLVAILFFLLSVAVNYFTAKRLFDQRLALLGLGLVVVCYSFWEYALSGLPQMLMLFLFSLCAYTLLRALEARGSNGSVSPWAAAAGLLFGLLALTHGLTICIFVGALLYVAFSFRPRGLHALIMLGVFLVVYTPWLVRNYQVCGNPLGLGVYSLLQGVTQSESEMMRSMKMGAVAFSPTTFHSKLQGQAIFQLNHFYELLGASIMAPMFFVSLLHSFKRPETASFRWLLLVMGAAASIGMGVDGLAVHEEAQSNALFILFVPLMIFYGLAITLVLFTRLEITMRLGRLGLIAGIFVISAFPLLGNLLIQQGIFHWPPYVPPFISILNTWTNDNEIIVSDMPWAVAWYADRKSLWLPTTIEDFVKVNDFNELGSPLVGLYLTPISGDSAFRREIVNGEYKDWAPFILGMVNLKNFPLHAVTTLPINRECIYYSDRNRWSERSD